VLPKTRKIYPIDRQINTDELNRNSENFSCEFFLSFVSFSLFVFKINACILKIDDFEIKEHILKSV